MDNKKNIELEAAAFRRLVNHLRNRTDVQNIDLMNLAGFCRNCLSKWYQEASDKLGDTMSKEQAREIIYGMPYEDWRKNHQTDSNEDQLRKFKENEKNKHTNEKFN